MRLALAATALALSGCLATTDVSRPITIEHHWYGETYRQENGRLQQLDMMSALGTRDAARPHVERWRRYFYGTMASAVVGGGTLGYGLGTLARPGGDRELGWALVGVGAGLFVAMEVMSMASASAAEDAIAAHNASFPSTAPPAVSCRLPTPWFAALPDGRGGTAGSAGLGGSF